MTLGLVARGSRLRARLGERWPVALLDGGAAAPPARERIWRSRSVQRAGCAPGPAAAAATARFPERDSSGRPDHGRDPHAAHQLGRSGTAPRTPRGAGPRATLDPYIHFAILSDFADAPAARCRRDAELLEAARAGIAATEPAPGERDAAISSISSIGCVSGTLREGAWIGLGAQTRETRGIQPPAARSDGHQLHGS